MATWLRRKYKVACPLLKWCGTMFAIVWKGVKSRVGSLGILVRLGIKLFCDYLNSFVFLKVVKIGETKMKIHTWPENNLL